MEQRRYTLDEIDRMRLGLRWVCNSDAGAEDQLRTHLLAGSDPEELYARCMDLAKARQDAMVAASRIQGQWRASSPQD